MTINTAIALLVVFAVGGQLYIIHQYLNDCYKAMGR